MSVHYKFKSALEYDTVAFDGLHISISDFKAAIIHQKRIGKTSDFDLQITNAQTKEVYSDNNALIPKNTSLLVARIPVTQQAKKSWDGVTAPVGSRLDPVAIHKGTTDLSRMEGSEEDKINAMISQSTLDYDPVNYQKIKGSNQRGDVPPNYRCYRCHEPGHWIKNCPLASGGEQLDIKRSTGIPRSFMVPVEGPSAPGAMMTPNGAFAVPVVDHEAYQAEEALMESGTGVGASAPDPPPRQEIPEDLLCSLCHDLLTDAVMIPCCGNSFCDECIRGVLLDSEDHECPDCREKDISPVTLIPNRFLRNSVGSFRNQTGYCPRPRPPVQRAPKPDVPEVETQAPEPQPPHRTENNDVQSNNQRSPNRNSSHEGDQFDDSDGSYDDNIIVKVPPVQSMQPQGLLPRGYGGNGNQKSNSQNISTGHHHHHHSNHPSSGGGPHGDHYTNNRQNMPPYGMHPGMRPSLKPPGMETPPNQHHNIMIGEERSGTPTVDEREQRNNQMGPMHHPPNHMQPPVGSNFSHAAPGTYPPVRPMGPYDFAGAPPRPPPPYGPPISQFQQSYQPLPPGAQGPPGIIEDPLEAFERMIREKEERARQRDKRSRTRSRSRSRTRSRTRSRSRSRYTRSRTRSRVRSRTPFSRSRSRSRPASIRSPGGRRVATEKYRSYSRSPVQRRAPLPPPPKRRSRERRSNSFSISRSRSVSRSRSPRSGRPTKRRRSPARYRSPLNTPPIQGAGQHSRPRFTGGASFKGSGRSNSQERPRPIPSGGPRPQRHFGNYGNNTGPSAAAVPHNRYNQRNNGPPPGHSMPMMGIKMVPPGMEVTGPRMRYGPPPFEDAPPGTQPPPPGFEHPQLDRREELPPSNIMDRNRDRIRPGSNYRDQRPAFRDGTMQNFKDGPPLNFRDGPPNNFREALPQQQFRENIPPEFRDHPNFREGPRENVPNMFREAPTNFRDGPPNFRDGSQNVFREPHQVMRNVAPIPPYRDSQNYRDGGPPHMRESLPQMRDGGMPQMREGPVHNRDNSYIGHEKPNRYHGRQDYNNDRGRDYRDQDRSRDGERRERDYDRNYERNRDDRYNRDRDVSDRPERDREHGSYYGTEKRRKSGSPRRGDTKEDRSRARGLDNRGRSRDSNDYKKEMKKDHDKEKKFDDDKGRERDKKIKDKKKKKKEKEEKKKRKEKKEKKEKIDLDKSDKNLQEKPVKESIKIDKEQIKPESASDKAIEDLLYNDILSDDIDRNVMESYTKDISAISLMVDGIEEKELFDNPEVKNNTSETKMEPENSKEKSKSEVLAPVPELSKWEMDDEQSAIDIKDSKDSTSPTVKSGKVTSEVLKRAENAIFAKAINAIRPIEIKKISLDRAKLYSNENSETNKELKKETTTDVRSTSPTTNNDSRSSEPNNESRKIRGGDKTPPPKLSVKERLGGKIDESNRRGWDDRVIHSTVERIKSRSKTPQRGRDSHRRTAGGDASRERNNYRRFDLDAPDENRTAVDETAPRKDEKRSHDHDKKKVRDHSPKERSKHNNDKKEKHRNRSESAEKKLNKKKDKKHKKEKDEKKVKKDSVDASVESKDITPKISEPPSQTIKDTVIVTERERKKSSLDEASFEPDYDETVESETETKDNTDSKKVQSKTPERIDVKNELPGIHLELSNIRKRTHSESSSSSSDSSSSSTSSGSAHKRRRKKRGKAKKKKSRQWKESVSDSENSSSDEPKKKKKKKKNRKKGLKKKKKSKHK